MQKFFYLEEGPDPEKLPNTSSYAIGNLKNLTALQNKCQSKS